MSDDDEQRYVQHKVKLTTTRSCRNPGARAECSCGWTSALYRGLPGAQLAWADHVREQGRDPLAASSRVGY